MFELTTILSVWTKISGELYRTYRFDYLMHVRTCTYMYSLYIVRVVVRTQLNRLTAALNTTRRPRRTCAGPTAIRDQRKLLVHVPHTYSRALQLVT